MRQLAGYISLVVRVLFLLLAAATPAAAAGSAAVVVPALPDSGVVNGVVTDFTTGRALPGTQVRIVGLARQDITHGGGEFHLTNLPAGEHTILFERIGYRREVREIVIMPGQTITLRIQMQTSAIALPGIVVTGSARENLGDRTVRPANVVSGQELARKLDVTVAGTLQNEPGLAVTSVGPATARPVIRGLGGDRVLVLEDGARVGDLSSTSSDHALSVDPLNAQRIEVVRGPAALLYGPNAIGGVINLIRDEVPSTRPDRPTGVASVQGQSVNRGIGAGASGHVGIGSFAIRAEASLRDAGDLRTPGGTLDNTSLRTVGASVGASEIHRWGHYGAAYRYYDNTYGIPGGFVGSHPDGVEIEMRRHAIHGETVLNRRAGPFTSFEVDAKYTNYYHRELEGPGIIGTEFGLLSGSGEASARHEEWGPFASGAVGTRVSWQDYAAGGSTGTPPTTELTFAGFVLEEIDLAGVRFQGGLRYDWHRVHPKDTETTIDIGDVRTRTFGSVSGSLGALYPIGRGASVGASVARAYRTPDTGELFSQGPHLAAYSFEVGNPDLGAEVGLGVDLFLRVQRDRLQGEVALFRNDISNYIYYRRTGAFADALPIYQAYGADAVLTGWEATASVEVIRHVVASATISHVRGTLAESDEALPAMPPLHGQVSVRYERPRYFTGVTWRAADAQDRVGEFETRTDGYSVLDADAGVRWDVWGRIQSLTVRVENATDEVVRDHLSRVKDIMPGAGAGVSVIYRVVF